MAESWECNCVGKHTPERHLDNCSTQVVPLADYERLCSVALAAKALVETAHDYVAIDETSVSEPALTALESALEAAGYGMTDDEGVESESP